MQPWTASEYLGNHLFAIFAPVNEGFVPTVAASKNPFLKMLITHCGAVPELLDGNFEGLFARYSTDLVEEPILCVLGGELERPPYTHLSQDIWHLDAECIVQNGDYVRLAKRFALLSKSALPIEHITDYIDLDRGVAWIEFSLAGKKIHWNLEVDDDWVDPGFYSKMQALVRNRDPKKGFFIAGLGQDSLISYGDGAVKDALSTFAGVEFTWE